MSVLDDYWSEPATLGRFGEMLLRGLAAVALVSVVIVGIQTSVSYFGGGDSAIMAIWAVIGFLAVFSKAFEITYPDGERQEGEAR